MLIKMIETELMFALVSEAKGITAGSDRIYSLFMRQGSEFIRNGETASIDVEGLASHLREEDSREYLRSQYGLKQISFRKPEEMPDVYEKGCKPSRVRELDSTEQKIVRGTGSIRCFDGEIKFLE